jgi:succinyl-diaminopimelate desuccinylase
VAANIVADRCSAVTSIRLVGGQTPEQVEVEVRQVLDDVLRDSGLPVHFNVEILGGSPAVSTPLDHSLVQATVEGATEATGTPCRVRGFTGGTEAGILCPALGLAMVVFGPGRLDQAHTVDEYVNTAELVQAATAYAKIAHTLLSESA